MFVSEYAAVGMPMLAMKMCDVLMSLFISRMNVLFGALSLEAQQRFDAEVTLFALPIEGLTAADLSASALLAIEELAELLTQGAQKAVFPCCQRQTHNSVALHATSYTT